MSDYIPFEIQSEIIKMLPVKSVIQFRSVSKQWKAFSDNPEFINNYHINHTNPQHHLFVSYQLDNAVKTYTSIVDNNTFPHQKFLLTAPESLCSLRRPLTLGPINGLVCFCGFLGDVAVIWNPTINKYVTIVIPISSNMCTILRFGFGVSRDDSDPKLVKINVDKISSMWVVEGFTLSTRVWRTVYTGPPFKSCNLSWVQVFIDGVIYFRAYDNLFVALGSQFSFVISYDLKSEKFGEVCLPDRLVHTPHLELTKVNESPGLLEYHFKGGMEVCGVWILDAQVSLRYLMVKQVL